MFIKNKNEELVWIYKVKNLQNSFVKAFTSEQVNNKFNKNIKNFHLKNLFYFSKSILFDVFIEINNTRYTTLLCVVFQTFTDFSIRNHYCWTNRKTIMVNSSWFWLFIL